MTLFKRGNANKRGSLTGGLADHLLEEQREREAAKAERKRELEEKRAADIAAREERRHERMLAKLPPCEVWRMDQARKREEQRQREHEAQLEAEAEAQRMRDKWERQMKFKFEHEQKRLADEIEFNRQDQRVLELGKKIQRRLVREENFGWESMRRHERERRERGEAAAAAARRAAEEAQAREDAAAAAAAEEMAKREADERAWVLRTRRQVGLEPGGNQLRAHRSGPSELVSPAITSTRLVVRYVEAPRGSAAGDGGTVADGGADSTVEPGDEKRLAEARAANLLSVAHYLRRYPHAKDHSRKFPALYQNTTTEVVGLKLGEKGGETLGRVLAVGAANKATLLNLGWNALRWRGCAGVTKGLARGGCPELRVLVLRANQLGDRSAEEVADALTAGCRKLEILDLRSAWHSNEIRDEGAKALAHALFLGGGPSLVELNLTQNRIADSGAAAVVKAAVSGGEQNTRPLERLVLRRNR